MFVITAIIGLSILVFFHELGHFFVAKISGIKVEEFGIGYPPRLLGIFKEKGKKRLFFGKNEPDQAQGKTIYSLNWIPFGGFNKLKGEMEKDNSPDSFRTAKWWKKFLVSIAGAGMNFLVAALIFFALYSTGIPQDIASLGKEANIVKNIGVQVGSVIPDSPADKSGIIMGDIIKKVDGKDVNNIKDIQEYINDKKGKVLNIGLKKNKNIVEKKVSIRSYKEVYGKIADIYNIEEDNPERGVIGASLAKSAIVKYPIHIAFYKGIKSTIGLASQICYGIFLMISSLISKGQMIGGLVGPVGITKITAGIASIGYIYLIQFLALLSVAIAVFQLIPFPALDGSRALFSIIEGIKGKPIKHKTENIIVSTGFILLLGLMGFVTLKEIIGLF